MIQFNKGSIEEVIVAVVDRFGTLTSLDAANPIFNVYSDDDDDDHVIVDQTASNNGMDAICLVDTSTLDPNTYKLYLQIQVDSNPVILGPERFAVNTL